MQEAFVNILNLLQLFGEAVQAVFLKFFSFEMRLALPFLCISLLTAYILYYLEYKRAEKAELKFREYMKFKDVYLHPSAMIDYSYYFVIHILNLIFILPIVGFILLQVTALAQRSALGLEPILGPSPEPVQPGIIVLMVYTVIVFCLSDLGHYIVHRVFHRFPMLWEFHKVHHSAEVLVPFTAERVHPVEFLAERIIGLFNIFIVSMICFYIYGSKLEPLQIFGANYVLFLFNALAANLRHTHIWFSFGPKIEHVINSPAQHQIHHSTDVKHYNKNFGTNLSVWDWMFGTLYVTTSKREDITYGLGEKENANFRTLRGVFFYPFKANMVRIKRKFNKALRKS